MFVMFTDWSMKMLLRWRSSTKGRSDVRQAKLSYGTKL